MYKYKIPYFFFIPNIKNPFSQVSVLKKCANSELSTTIYITLMYISLIYSIYIWFN